jgi:hypothetical protein
MPFRHFLRHAAMIFAIISILFSLFADSPLILLLSPFLSLLIAYLPLLLTFCLFSFFAVFRFHDFASAAMMPLRFRQLSRHFIFISLILPPLLLITPLFRRC